MFSGGIGQMDSRHVKKAEPEKGMLVVKVGGPAYRIGEVLRELSRATLGISGVASAAGGGGGEGEDGITA